MIQNLDPTIVWKNFYALTQIPRPSKHEEKVSQYLYEFGKNLGLETIRDKAGNVIIRKPATPGYETRKGVILQGHMDMVPQKTPDTVHDFLTDPIQTWIDGEWVKAKGTTLGADNGMGVALALSVLESKDIKHGPIEALFTVDEETGMTGAMVLAPGLLGGEILINCDSESEGQLCVGCAGGLDFKATDTYEPKPWNGTDLCYTLAVKKCRGGHSGLEIHEYRCNANKALCRILYALLTQTDVKLLDMEGGSLRNAIPLASFATIYIPKASLSAVKDVVENVFGDIKTEFAQTDPNMELVFEEYKCAEGETCNHDTDCAWVPAEDALRYVQVMLACPNGVERFSATVPGLVETSNNMAIVKIEKGRFEVSGLTRSSVDSAKFALADAIVSAFALAGITVELSGAYSGWMPNPTSGILATMKSVYKKMYGEEPKVVADHAGLECGILGGTYPGLDMVSCGPTLRSPHSPDERLNIPSVGRTWEYLKAVLEAIPEK